MTVRVMWVRSRVATAIVGSVALAGVFAACGSSNSKTSSSTTSGGSVATTSGPSSSGGQVASGAPITLQIANLQGSTEGVNLPATTEAAQAAVAYINHHGGVQGRPLKLTVCDLLTTPASDVSCANSMAAAHPVAEVGGAVDNGDPIVTAAAAAGIPYVAPSGTSDLELTSSDSFLFTPGNDGGYNAVAAEEQKLGGKKVSVILVSAAGAGAVAAQSEAAAKFKAHGISVTIIVDPPGNADLTPQIQAATSNGSTGVYIDTDPTTCIEGLRARGTLSVGSSIRFYMDDSCELSSVFKGAGANANGVYIGNPADLSNKQDSDTALYQSAMSQFGPGVDPQGFAPVGFIGVWDLYKVMKTIPSGTAVTAASVKAALKSTTNTAGFMADGGSFTCNGSVFKAEPTVCGNAFFLEQYTTSGGIHFVGKFLVPSGS